MPETEWTRSLFAGINRAADPMNLTDLEKRHLPMIEAPPRVRRGEPFFVAVCVGQLLAHPRERNHFIEFVEIYADELLLARVALTAVSTMPEATLRIRLTGPTRQLLAIDRCNLHGVWSAAVPIAVDD
jgi:superoxide reductase